MIPVVKTEPLLQASTDFAPQLDYRLRHVGGVPVLEEHSAARGADAADGPVAGQAGAVTEINPVLPAERLATQCHQDAVLALASVEVRAGCVWCCGCLEYMPNRSSPALDLGRIFAS